MCLQKHWKEWNVCQRFYSTEILWIYVYFLVSGLGQSWLMGRQGSTITIKLVYVCQNFGIHCIYGHYRVWIHSETWQEHTVKCTIQMSTQNTSRSFGQFSQMVECSFKNYVVLGLSPVAVTSPSDFAPALSKEFLDIQATIECGFTLKCIRDMTRTYRLIWIFHLKIQTP